MRKALAGRMIAAVTVTASLLAVAPQAAHACTPLVYSDEVRYIGGDFAEQYAAKANTIQIVEVTRRELLARYFTRAEIFEASGRWRGPPSDGLFDDPHRDIFVFEMRVIETLKGGQGLEPPRVRALDLSVQPLQWLGFGRMLNSVLDDPAPDRRVVELVAVDPTTLDACVAALALAVGDRYLVVRDEHGDIPVPRGNNGEWTNALSLDAELVREGRSAGAFSLPAPTVIPINADTAEFVSRLRSALARY